MAQKSKFYKNTRHARGLQYPNTRMVSLLNTPAKTSGRYKLLFDQICQLQTLLKKILCIYQHPRSFRGIRRIWKFNRSGRINFPIVIRVVVNSANFCIIFSYRPNISFSAMSRVRCSPITILRHFFNHFSSLLALARIGSHRFITAKLTMFNRRGRIAVYCNKKIAA